MTLLEKDKRIIEHVLRYCLKIQGTIRRFGENKESVLNDSDYRDSISMNLLQIGELSGKLSPEFVQATRQDMDWRAIKSMRNMFAHDYGSMDQDMIWYTASTDIPLLMKYCVDLLK